MLGPIRSLLFVPGTRPDRFEKALAAGADAVVFDMEDSVGADQKDQARANIAEFLAGPRSGSSSRLIRLNPVLTAFGAEDLAFFQGRSGFDGVLLPKVETPQVLETAARALGGAVSGASPPLLPLLESPRAVLRAFEIASANAPVAALLLGAEDFSAALGVVRTLDGEELVVARGQIAMAAAAVGAEAIDAVFTRLDDEEGLRRDCARARSVGFLGKMAIHPRQVAAINEVFTPSAAEVERAQRLIAAYEEALARGEGVTRLGGEMVELPMVLRARRLLALAGRSR